jgi:hypothetical protein
MMAITTASALPARGSWGSFAQKLLQGITAVRERSQQQRILLTHGEPGHPTTLANMEAAARQRDVARMRASFEGFSVMIPE